MIPKVKDNVHFPGAKSVSMKKIVTNNKHTSMSCTCYLASTFKSTVYFVVLLEQHESERQMLFLICWMLLLATTATSTPLHIPLCLFKFKDLIAKQHHYYKSNTHSTCVYTHIHTNPRVASFPGHSQILSRSCGENLGDFSTAAR